MAILYLQQYRFNTSITIIGVKDEWFIWHGVWQEMRACVKSFQLLEGLFTCWHPLEVDVLTCEVR